MRTYFIAALTVFGILSLFALGSYFILRQSWKEDLELRIMEFNYFSASDYIQDHGKYPVNPPDDAERVDCYREVAFQVSRIYTKIKVKQLPTMDKMPAYLGAISPRDSTYTISYDNRPAPALKYMSWWDSNEISHLPCYKDLGLNKQPSYWVNFQTNTIYTFYRK